MTASSRLAGAQRLPGFIGGCTPARRCKFMNSAVRSLEQFPTCGESMGLGNGPLMTAPTVAYHSSPASPLTGLSTRLLHRTFAGHHRAGPAAAVAAAHTCQVHHLHLLLSHRCCLMGSSVTCLPHALGRGALCHCPWRGSKLAAVGPGQGGSCPLRPIWLEAQLTRGRSSWRRRSTAHWLRQPPTAPRRLTLPGRRRSPAARTCPQCPGPTGRGTADKSTNAPQACQHTAQARRC